MNGRIGGIIFFALCSIIFGWWKTIVGWWIKDLKVIGTIILVILAAIVAAEVEKIVNKIRSRRQ